MLPAISVNKGRCSHQATTAALTVSHEGTQEGDKRAAYCLSHCSHPRRRTLRGLRMGKNRILA